MMKKRTGMRAIAVLLCTVMVLASVATALVLHAGSTAYQPVNASAQGVTFTPNAQGTAYEVTDYLGSAKDVLIPAEYEGKPVESITSSAFLKASLAESDGGAIKLPFDWFGTGGNSIAVKTVTFASKTVVIEDSAKTVPESVTVYGYAGSTAESYAEKYGRTFVQLPEIQTAYLSLASDITVNYKTVLSETQKNAVMRFTVNGKSTIVSPEATDVAGEYLFRYEGITPQMMGESICAELMLGDTVIATKAEYSVKQYCLNMKQAVADELLDGYDADLYAALDILISDLLHYGAMAQIYANYKTDALMNEGVTGQRTFVEMTSEYAPQKPDATTAADGTHFLGAYATLDNLVRLNFVVGTNDISKVTLVIGDTVYTTEDFRVYADASVYGMPAYCVTAPAIYANELDTIYLLSLRVDGVECQTLRYGVVNYLYSKQNDANESLKQLVRAIRNYGLSADEYETASSLAIVKDGATAYRVVYSASASDEVMAAATQLCDAIKAVTGVTVTAVSDATANDGSAKEILVGSTNRTASSEVASPLSATQYAFAIKGNNRDVVIAGGSDQAVVFAVREFLRVYAGYTSASQYTRTDAIVLGTDFDRVAQASVSDHVTLYVVDDTLSYLDHLQHSLEMTAEVVTVYSMETDLADVFDADTTGLVLIAGIDQVSAECKTALYNYMCSGGRILTMGNDYSFKSTPSGESDDLVISTLCDATELYPVNSGVSIGAFENQIFVEDRDYVLPESLFSCYPRQIGIGYDNGLIYRCIPLIEVKDSLGLRAGYAAWMMLFAGKWSNNGDMEGSMLACFSGSEDFYDANGIAAVMDTVKTMMRDRFLLDGGVNEHTYLTGVDTDARAGTNYVSLRSDDQTGLEVKISLYKDNELLTQYTTAGRSPAVAGVMEGRATARNFYSTHSFEDGTPDHVVTSMYLNGEEIDRIEQDVYYWEPKPVSERSFVTKEDGYFKKDGEIIHLFGVNFAQSSRAGENDYYTWMGNADYDPESVADDLARVKDIGFNAVAVWVSYDGLSTSNNMVDFLRRCEELGLYVDLGISGDIAYPLLEKYDPDKVEQWLTEKRFVENDTIVSYDIAWEERIGTYEGKWWKSDDADSSVEAEFVGRKGWDDEWTQWVIDQYGSIANAESVWGASCLRTDEGYLYISNDMMDETSTTYHKMIAAYYRFLDDIVAREMYDGILSMRNTASDQLISFRMSMAGCGYKLWNLYKPSISCFDFQSLAPVLDMMEPEGYTLGNNWEQSVQIPIAAAYARYTKPDAPVVWKEFSFGVIDSNYDQKDYNFNPVEGYEENSADCYEWAFKYMLYSELDAVFSWWTMPGYRRGENGDSGIWNPDGSDRLYTGLFREYAPKFIGQGERSTPGTLVTVERDNQVGGIFGIYDVTKDAVQAAYTAGKTVAFVNNLQTSAGQVLYADQVYQHSVADTTKTGTYPLRYVNGMVKSVTVTQNGTALVTVCNTKQSTWRAGTVSLVSTASSDIAVDVTINEEVSYLEDVVVEVPIGTTGDLSLRFEINGVAFGPVYTTTVQ